MNDDEKPNGSILIQPEAYLRRRELEAKFAKWDVIIWNNGTWDISCSDQLTPCTLYGTEAAYAANLSAIATRLRQTGAKIVFLTTLPGAVNGPPKTPIHYELLDTYNQIARDTLAAFGDIEIADINAYASARTDLMHTDNIHWSTEGRKYLSLFFIKTIEDAVASIRE